MLQCPSRMMSDVAIAFLAPHARGTIKSWKPKELSCDLLPIAF